MDMERLSFTFIGTWDLFQNDVKGGVFIFSENTFIDKMSEEEYAGKGTWVTETPDKLILTYTHSRSTGHHYSVDDLPELAVPEILECTYDHISVSEFKLTILVYGIEFICKKRN